MLFRMATINGFRSLAFHILAPIISCQICNELLIMAVNKLNGKSILSLFWLRLLIKCKRKMLFGQKIFLD